MFLAEIPYISYDGISGLLGFKDMLEL